MLFLLRVFFTGLFAWLLWRASDVATGNLDADVANAGHFALAIIVGFGAAITWAPLLGEIVAGPMTGTLTDGSVSQDATKLIRFIRRCEARGWRRATLLLCFAEGVRHPNLPAAFVVGMDNASAGSWLEKVFAKEVFRFSNVANCVRAHDLLKLRHDVDPGLHPQPEVNLALLAHIREARPDAAVVAVPPAPPAPPLGRKRSIKLFAAADAAKPPAASTEEDR
jgi:hypothetical protein